MSIPCLCGATDCQFCGPAQGSPWCYEHKQSAQYCCAPLDDCDDYCEDYYDDHEPEEIILDITRLDNGWY